MGEVKKYQHLIPKVYMKQWQSRKEKNTNKNMDVYVYKYDKDKIFETGEEVNINGIGGINDYHTITKDSLFVTIEDLKRIKNGELRLLDIEDGWQKKLENGWQSIINKINNDILKAKKKQINAFKKKEIINFIICMEYRGFKGIDIVRAYIILAIIRLGKILNFEEEFTQTMIEYYAMDDEKAKNYLLSDMRRFLDNDTNSFIYNKCNLYAGNTEIVFDVAPDGIEFLTSDNPSFETTIKTKRVKGKIHLMPISPKVVAIIYRSDNKNQKYFINKITIDEVKNINKAIIESSKRFILSSKSSIKSFI